MGRGLCKESVFEVLLHFPFNFGDLGIHLHSKIC